MKWGEKRVEESASGRGWVPEGVGLRDGCQVSGRDGKIRNQKGEGDSVYGQ